MEIQIQGLEDLRARLASMRAATQNLQPALLRAGIVVDKAAADRIDAGGPGWAPNTTGTPLLHRTGRLLASLTVSAAGAGGSDSVMDVSANQIVVGTNVFYARYLQDGTGVYGASGQPITAANGKALAFKIGGRSVIVRSVRGTPARKFLFIDSQVADRVASVFAAHVMGRNIQEAGT